MLISLARESVLCLALVEQILFHCSVKGVDFLNASFSFGQNFYSTWETQFFRFNSNFYGLKVE